MAPKKKQRQEAEFYTYLLEGVSQPYFETIGKGAKIAEKHRTRVILITKGRHEFVAPVRVVKESPGDMHYLMNRWIYGTILDDLHGEFLRSMSNITVEKQKKAIKAWQDNLIEKEKLTLKLAALTAESSERSADVLRVVGRSPIVVNGITYDPNHNGAIVYFIRRHDRKRPLAPGQTQFGELGEPEDGKMTMTTPDEAPSVKKSAKGKRP